MQKTLKKIVFFGTEDFSLTALKGLVEAGYNVVAVITKPDSKRGRKQILTPPSVKIYAESQQIAVWQPVKLSDITDDIMSLGDVAGVLVSYGKIIPGSIISLFNPGIINVHPSLLPLYRGPSPIESVIANGDSQTGVTIMSLEARMDAGPIYSQITYPLSGRETKPELYRTLAGLGTKRLLDNLPVIFDESLRPKPQDEAKATYCSILTKDDSLIQPDLLTATEAERRVRAYLGYPKTKIQVLGKEIFATKAHITHESKTPLDIECKDGTYLSIDELVAPSGHQMDARAFLNGYAAG
jgi:methionyl-tRNA formyltransferase